MRFVIALVLILLAAPLTPARAENELPEKELRPTVAETVVEVEEPTPPSLAIEEVKIADSEAVAAEADATQEMPRRGSFWWLVGVIVVAGVILAVLLD